MPTDPSLGTISMSVQVPELALVAQQVGCLLMLIHCLHWSIAPDLKGLLGMEGCPHDNLDPLMA